MKFNCVEDAYLALAQESIAFAGLRQWHQAGGDYKIYNRMVSSEWWIEGEKGKDETGNAPPREISKPAFAAIRFLRDDLLATTGDRIWGLNFTLYPDGKFNIEYDYNKPADYEETDEVISGDEINESLSNIREDNSKG